jgi:hypothetical protein
VNGAAGRRWACQSLGEEGLILTSNFPASSSLPTDGFAVANFLIHNFYFFLL